ncbi:hypothetical protein [Flavilitoribacter nigricans]|uniref:Uncharacterized protein n=1 Tax=Flavilitoribacter nigricans (strain ATCC 23147 / DSM 23189 / NBRC 102662 / NCIMB 1420 / SS-2) TaxID=1122177 RepID=A0A2D0NFI8_FLAN2|nr:hypothetical protein [Flavilitoribacter nigricans]PHN07136.1 hypothetical protein CRP01_07870 [Flavilitoribacter nigricans DSM 23189 = NBRC 102662]
MDYLFFVLMGVVALPIVFTFLFIWLYNRNRARKSAETQNLIQDREILRFIGSQPDGLISIDQLVEHSKMTRSQARVRLNLLREFGVLEPHYAAGFRAYYSLAGPLDERPAPKLSPEPFLTVEDMLTLFKHFDFRITPQQLIMSTGLPVTILRREMKYFQKQGILQSLTPYGQIGTAESRSYVLMEPYRSNPERFLDQRLDLDRQMESILRKEDLV